MARGRREDKRQRIIDAAVEVFADKGFFSAKISEIAKAAGVADGTIYLYFKGKDDLLVSLFREKMGIILTRLTELVSRADGPEAKLRSYVTEHLELVAEQPKLMQVLTVELRQSGRFMKQHGGHRQFARYLAVIASVIDEGQKSGLFDASLDAITVSRALFGALDEMSRAWVLGAARERPPFDRRVVAEQLGDFFLRGLRPASPPQPDI